VRTNTAPRVQLGEAPPRRKHVTARPGSRAGDRRRGRPSRIACGRAAPDRTTSVFDPRATPGSRPNVSGMSRSLRRRPGRTRPRPRLGPPPEKPPRFPLAWWVTGLDSLGPSCSSTTGRPSPMATQQAGARSAESRTTRSFLQNVPGRGKVQEIVSPRGRRIQGHCSSTRSRLRQSQPTTRPSSHVVRAYLQNTDQALIAAAARAHRS